MSAGRHQEVGPLTTRGQPIDFSLYNNIQYKNTQFSELSFKGGDNSNRKHPGGEADEGNEGTPVA
jgi:hypothetical protein